MPELKDENTGYFVPQEDKRRDIFTERLYDHVKKHHEVTLYFFLILHKYILIANMTLGGFFFLEIPFINNPSKDRHIPSRLAS
jgi:hypothetical protein